MIFGIEKLVVILDDLTMKKFHTYVLLLAALTSNAFAATIPLSPELEARLNQIGPKRVAKAIYDVALHGGASSAHALGVDIPDNAVITRSYMYINTAFTGSDSTPTLAIGCQAAANLRAAAQLTGWSATSLIDGVSTGASSVFQKITEPCTITATGAVLPFTAGKLTLWVEYLLAE